METPDMTVSHVENKQSASRPREAPGLLRELLSVEWKLFRRNRRPRWMLVFFGVVSVLFGVVSLLAALLAGITINFDLIFLSYLIDAMIIFTVAGVGLRSSFYDSLLSRPVSQGTIVHNVVLTFHIFVSCFFVLPTLAFLINFVRGEPNDLYRMTSMFLYVLGIINYLMVFLSALEPNCVELNVKLSELNVRSPIVKEFQNLRTTLMIVLFLILAAATPLVLWGFFPGTHGIVFPAMFVLGLAGLLFHAGWVRLIARSLQKRRYELLERFRLLEEFWRG